MIQIVRDSEQAIVELILDRPKVNAMNTEMLLAMARAWETLEEDETVHGVLVRGRGRCFSAGLDLVEVYALDYEGLEHFLGDFDRILARIFSSRLAVACAVEGAAIAGGMVLALCSDYFALAPDAKVGLTELAVGIPFPSLALEIVRHGLADQRAMRRFVYGSDVIGGAEAYEMGCGDSLTDDPVGACRAWLETVTRHPRRTFELVKQAMRQDAQDRIEEAPTWAREEAITVMLSDETRAAMTKIMGAKLTTARSR